MIASIDFDDELSRRSKEICDVSVEEDDLAPEGDSELTRIDGGPERGFGGVWMTAHESGAFGE